MKVCLLGPATYSGRIVSVWPRGLQEPHPPVFYSGNSLESAEFAAAHRLNLAIGLAPAEVVAQNVEHYRRAAAEAGWEPTNDNGGVLPRAGRPARRTPDDQQADDATSRHGAGRR